MIVALFVWTVMAVAILLSCVHSFGSYPSWNLTKNRTRSTAIFRNRIIYSSG